jgi:hypothetical protein
MRITKFFVTNSPVQIAGTHGIIHHEYRVLGNLYLHRTAIESTMLKAIEGAMGVRAMPGLNAPASALSADFLAQIGVAPVAGDSVLNILRRWRNANGTDDSFDISE